MPWQNSHCSIGAAAAFSFQSSKNLSAGEGGAFTTNDPDEDPFNFPVALEGALKLKEISYIHAEAYPAGELKHGPLALVDSEMPVVVIAPNDSLLEKVKSNIQEVRARGGEMFVFADADSHFGESEQVHVIRTPRHVGVLSPIVHSIPVQLLAYHAALARGTDVDKPRNLAKSVTVE